jgi:hemerythrin-like domain-containing protein
MFLGALERVALVIDRSPTDDTRAAPESALCYFREAAPKHTADEEESLFPRLRQMNLSDVESAVERLEALEHDHVLTASLYTEVEELGQRYLATGRLEAAGVKVFREAIASLVSIYKQHIDIEDNLVFPLAARLLAASDKSAIAGEMAASRELRIVDIRGRRA